MNRPSRPQPYDRRNKRQIRSYKDMEIGKWLLNFHIQYVRQQRTLTKWSWSWNSTFSLKYETKAIANDFHSLSNILLLSYRWGQSRSYRFMPLIRQSKDKFSFLCLWINWVVRKKIGRSLFQEINNKKIQCGLSWRRVFTIKSMVFETNENSFFKELELSMRNQIWRVKYPISAIVQHRQTFKLKTRQDVC